MAKCKRTRIGEYDTLIQAQVRNITAPETDSVDFGESFINEIEIFAKVRTLTHRAEFDQTGIEFSITHEIRVPYIPGIEFEWFLVNGQRPRVVSFHNVDEANIEFVFLTTNRGNQSNEASFA